MRAWFNRMDFTTKALVIGLALYGLVYLIIAAVELAFEIVI